MSYKSSRSGLIPVEKILTRRPAGSVEAAAASSTRVARRGCRGSRVDPTPSACHRAGNNDDHVPVIQRCAAAAAGSGRMRLEDYKQRLTPVSFRMSCPTAPSSSVELVRLTVLRRLSGPRPPRSE